MVGNEKHVLVVDDRSNLRQVLRDLMQHQGFRVSLAENGQEGLRIAEKDPPDLVVMDMSMPVLDGIETTRRMRATTNLERTPILFLTANSQSEDEARAREAGATAFIPKPFSPRKVMAVIEDLLN